MSIDDLPDVKLSAPGDRSEDDAAKTDREKIERAIKDVFAMLEKTSTGGGWRPGSRNAEAVKLAIVEVLRSLDGPILHPTGITAGDWRTRDPGAFPDVPDVAELWCTSWKVTAEALDGGRRVQLNTQPVDAVWRWVTATAHFERSAEEP